MTSKAAARRRKHARPSLPRMMGANDNVISPAIDDRDALAKRVARERRAAEKADAEAQAARLSAQGVDVVLHPGNIVRAKRVGGLEWLLQKQRKKHQQQNKFLNSLKIIQICFQICMIFFCTYGKNGIL